MIERTDGAACPARVGQRRFFRTEGKGIFVITVLMLAPIVAAILILIFDLRRGINKRAFYISAIITMAIAMFAMKRVGTWYAFLFSVTVPLALLYTGCCFYMSLRAGKGGEEDDTEEERRAPEKAPRLGEGRQKRR